MRWSTVLEYKLSHDGQFFFRQSGKKVGIYLYNLPMSDAVGTSYHHIYAYIVCLGSGVRKTKAIVHQTAAGRVDRKHCVFNAKRRQCPRIRIKGLCG